MKKKSQPRNDTKTKLLLKGSLIGTIFGLFFANSLAADNSIAFDDGWCIGRSTLILTAYPDDEVAQDVYLSHSKSFILNGLKKFGANAKNRKLLLETITEMEQQVLSQALAFSTENGIEALRQDIDKFYSPEMLRRCRLD